VITRDETLTGKDYLRIRVGRAWITYILI